MAREPVIVVEQVSKRFRIYHQRNLTLKGAILQRGRGHYEDFWAVRDVNLEVAAGSTLGIIGENGSGKSTLLKLIAGIIRPDAGKVHAEGRLAALLELGAGFHPEYSGRENIYLNGALLGLPRRYIDSVYDDIIEFAGEQIKQFIDSPVKTYSSGMYARIGFSIAVHLDPDILVVDEILAVGDEAFQRRCYDRIAQLKAQGRTLVLVSHALESIRELCTECVWIEHGRVRQKGRAEKVISEYLTEVNARETQVMRGEAEEVHRKVPSGREGVGVSRVVFNGSDGAAQVFETGDPFEVGIEYHAPRPLKGARFTLEFLREDGVLAFSSVTDDEEMSGAVLPAQGVVRFRVDRLPLLEGLFRAGVTITDIETEEPYTVLEAAFPFRVRNIKMKERGVALIGHEWAVPAEIVGGGAKRAG
jgi:ABC-type polysaccharide/polyol phosphate transport system ATPase subunit